MGWRRPSLAPVSRSGGSRPAPRRASTASTIDWAGLDSQPGDDPPPPFSFVTDRITTPQIACHITTTTAATHAVIRANLHRSPMYSGDITGTGPRYCPSIEDKIVRFAERDRHQIFLEPEGLDDDTIYPNGISTSLPREVQEAFLHTIPGLEHAVIRRPGYAIEYDFVDPRELYPSLGDPPHARVFILPARSTAPPAMRKPRHRGSSPGSTRRWRQRGRSR